MPLFELQGPDGATYEVDAPDERSAAAAFKKMGTAPQPQAPAGHTFDLMLSDEERAAVEGRNRAVLETPEARGARSAQENPIASGLMAAGGGVLEGAPIVGPYLRSGGERLAAGMLTLRDGNSFDDNLAAVKAAGEQAKADHPAIDTASQITGGVAVTVPMIAAAPAAFGAGGGGLAARSLASGATGAAIGGADAAVRSGGDLDATKSGAALGGILGGASPAVGAGLGKLASALMDKANPATRSGALAQALKAASADGLDDAARAKLAQMGPDAMVADLGPNLSGVLEGVVQTPGPGQTAARAALAERAAGAGQRIQEATNKALGSVTETVGTIDDLIAQRSAAAKPLYETAYAKPMPSNPAIQEALSTPAGKSAWARAQRLAANEGIPLNLEAPDVRSLDLTKRAIDDMISTATRQGKGNDARVLSGLRDRLLSAVDEAVPEYAQARQAFSGPSALIDAMEQGRSVFGKSMTPAELQKALSALSEGEQEAFKQGARAAVADTMGTARNDALAARNLFSQGYNRDKLALLVGDDEASRLLSALDFEGGAANLKNAVEGNSRTAARSQIVSELQGKGDPSVVGEALNMNFGNAARVGKDKLVEALIGKKSDKMGLDLAKILTAKGSDADRVVETLISARQGGTAGMKADKATQALVRALMSGGAPAIQQQHIR